MRRQQALWLEKILQTLGVIVVPAIKRLSKREESGDSRFGLGTDQFNQLVHGHAAPLGDAAPSLNAMMHGDVLNLADALKIGQGKLDRILDQAADLQPEVPESGFRHALPIVANGH